MAGKSASMSRIKQVLQLSENGVSNRQIASDLDINKETLNNCLRFLIRIHLLAIYLPVAVCVAFGVVFVRYLSPVFMKSSGTIVRVLFVLWAAVTLFFPLAVNKVYFTLPFAVGYTVVYLLLSWVMLSLETIKKTN